MDIAYDTVITDDGRMIFGGVPDEVYLWLTDKGNRCWWDEAVVYVKSINRHLSITDYLFVKPS